MHALAAISLASPLMLLGIAGVAAPLLAHLLSRRASRRVVFPSIWLLRDSAAGRARLQRLRQRALLALRTAAVVALALAFAQPLWSNAGPLAQPGASKAVVFVIDNSASAGQLVDGVSAAYSLRAAAEREAARLRDGRVGLAFAATPAGAAWPGLTSDRSLLSEHVNRFAPSAARADLPAAVRIADKLLREHNGPREIVILSDMQATNWSGVRLESEAPRRIVAIDAGRGQNLALRHPRVHPAAPLAGRTVTLSAELANLSDRPATVSVAAEVAEKPLAAETVTVEPHTTRQVSFRATLPEGVHTVIFRIPTDALDADNAIAFDVRVEPHATVLLVSDDASAPAGGAAYFLTRALAPRGEADAVRARTATPAELAPRHFEAVGVAVLDLGQPLAAAGRDALLAFVERGGGLLVFAGPRAEATPGFLPMRRDEIRDGQGLSLADGSWRSPSLAVFDEPARRALRRVRFRRVWAVQLQPGATPLLTFSDGSAALAEHRVGGGRVIMANFSPEPAASDLATHGIFPALLHSLIDDLRPSRDTAATVAVGEPIAFPFDATPLGRESAAVQIAFPDGARRPATWTAIDGQLRTHVESTANPGVYRLMHGDRVLASVPVHVDPRESDLAVVDASAITRTAAGTMGAAASAATPPGSDTELWPWFAGLAALAIGVELAALAAWRSP